MLLLLGIVAMAVCVSVYLHCSVFPPLLGNVMSVDADSAKKTLGLASTKYHSKRFDLDKRRGRGQLLLSGSGGRSDSDHLYTRDIFPNVTVAISIISAARTPTRLRSLQRLCNSLLKADYLGRKDVHLRFHMDSDSSSAALEYVLRLQWPNGPKTINHRVKKGGLVAAVSESWYPASEFEHAVILEDDIEVSPYFFIWLSRLV